MALKISLADRARFLAMVDGGQSQASVARLAGVSKGMVNRWVQSARVAGVKPESRILAILPNRRPPRFNTVVTRADGTQYVEDKWACGKWKLNLLEDK